MSTPKKGFLGGGERWVGLGWVFFCVALALIFIWKHTQQLWLLSAVCLRVGCSGS